MLLNGHKGNKLRLWNVKKIICKYSRSKKKIEQKKLEEKSLDIRDWDLEDIPPSLPGRGDGDEAMALPPPPCPKKISRIGVLLSQMKLMSKQFKTEFQKKNARSFKLVQCNTEFRKKLDPLKIFLSCKGAYYKDIPNFFLSKLAELWLNDVQTRKMKNKK